jgi:hypothetical protein
VATLDQSGYTRILEIGCGAEALTRQPSFFLWSLNYYGWVELFCVLFSDQDPARHSALIIGSVFSPESGARSNRATLYFFCYRRFLSLLP